MIYEPAWKSFIATTINPIFTAQECENIIKIGHQQPPRSGKVGGQKDASKYRASVISWIPFSAMTNMYKMIETSMLETNRNHFGFEGMQLGEIGQFTEYKKGGFYNLGNNGEKQPVNAYLLTNLILSPNNWFWESDRFQPFLGIESIFIKYTSNNIIDPINSNVLSKLESYPFSSHLLNMEYGFLVKGFKVSYRWINFNLSGDKVNNTKNAYPIPPIRHMEVIWQFLN